MDNTITKSKKQNAPRSCPIIFQQQQKKVVMCPKCVKHEHDNSNDVFMLPSLNLKMRFVNPSMLT